jgi:adenosylmethionine-8-amino-7-oxononanoate aminotransferase
MSPISKKEKATLIKQAQDHFWMHAKIWDPFMTNPEMLIIMDQAEGTHIIDVDGNKYFDLMSGLWLVNVGHGRKEIANAVYEQMQKVCYVNTWEFPTVPAIKLATKLASLAPGDLDCVYFVSNGSDAVDTAWLMAKQYQYLDGFPKRYKLITKRRAYHGVGSGAHAATGPGFFTRKYIEPMVPGVVHSAAPFCYRCEYGLMYPSCNLLCASDVERQILTEDPDTVAAVMGETISGSPGVISPPPEYWPMVRSICDKYGILLILDEVICGFGRTGKWFACDGHYSVIPDIMTVAKGITSGYLPLAAVIAKKKVRDKFKPGWVETFQHGYTWNAHPVCCAAALSNLEIIEREKLVENAAEVGAYLMELLEDLRSHPTVGDVRGKGLLAAVEFVKDKKTKESFVLTDPFNVELTQQLRKMGIIGRVRNILGIAPPLITTKSEVEWLVSGLDKALGEVEKKLFLMEGEGSEKKQVRKRTR